MEFYGLVQMLVLCSYDGRELTVYDHNDGLPNNFIRDIQNPKRGKFGLVVITEV